VIPWDLITLGLLSAVALAAALLIWRSKGDDHGTT